MTTSAMTGEALPSFRYHPDPLGTGSVERRDGACISCGRPRGFLYVGPVYGRKLGLRDSVCPWCIADGSAAERFDAMFTDIGRPPPSVPHAVRDEIARRTPGFMAWQQDYWLYHCDDAAAFLGLAGYDDVAGLPDALESLRADMANMPAADLDEYIESLTAEDQPTAYLFRCLHCGTHLAFSDFT